MTQDFTELHTAMRNFAAVYGKTWKRVWQFVEKMMPIRWPLLAGLCHLYGSLAISIILKQGEAVTKAERMQLYP
jgi:hypothetical protein